MRKLLLLILFPVIAYSQSGTPRVRVDSLISFTPASFVRMNDSLQLAQFLEADSTAFSVAPSFGKGRLVFRGDAGIFWWDGNSRWRLDTNYTGTFALKTYVDSIANLKVDTIYRTSGKDSIQFTLGGRYHAIRDSVGNAIRRVLESDGSPSVANVDSLQFNSTNFSLTNPSGARVAVNTVQNIDTTATPKFSGGSIVNSFTAGDASLLISSDYAAGQNAYIEFDHQPTIGNHYVFKFGSGIGLLRTAFTLQDVTDSKDIYYGFLGGGLGIGSTANNGLLTVGNAGQFYVDTLGNVTTSGKLTLSSLTSGSVPFIGTGGAFRQNNAKFFWDSTNARLGIFGQPADVYGSKLEVFGKGRFVLNSSTWPTTAAGGANWGVRDAWLYGVSDSGDIGVGGFSRTNKSHNGSSSTIGVGGFLINDSTGRTGWALYGDVQHDSGAASIGLELALKNKVSNYTTTPYSRVAGVTGIWLAGGGDPSYGGAATHPTTAAIQIVKNDTVFNKGIVIEDDAITGTDGVTGTGIGIEMAKGHEINWLSAAGQGARIRSDVVTSGKDVGIIFGNDSISFQLASGAEMAKFTPTATQASAGRNYLTLTGSTGAGATEYTTKQADANGVAEGVIQFTDVNSSAADKRTSAILGILNGAKANNRGGDILFYTKGDSVSGLNERVRINQAGNFGIGDNAPGALLSVGSGGKLQVNVNGKINKINSISTEGGFGAPTIVDTVEKGAQTASISATNLTGTTIAGAYEIEYYGSCTAADGTSTVTITIDWDNNTKSTTSASFSNAATTNYIQGHVYIRHVPVSASSIRYSTTLTGTIGAATYQISVTAKRIY